MRVMVLGGGNCQINLIKRLKEEGDEIILVDYLPDCMGIEFCDTHFRISTFDIPAVLDAAKQSQVEAIVTLGTDQPVYTAAVVADSLVLPFYLTPGQALSATNKRVMKKIFTDNNISTAVYRLLDKDFDEKELSGIRFPAVMKPVDSQGQRGIFKVDSVDEVRYYFDETLKFSRENKILVEEFYKSEEITVNGWLTDGKLNLLSVVDRVTISSGKHIGICVAHNFPSLHLSRQYDNIVNLTDQIIRAFGFENGPVYFQYLIGEEGIKVNEIAMRVGGAYEDITIPVITGIDILGLLLNAARGKSSDSIIPGDYSLKNNSVFLSTQMFFLNPGRINSIFCDYNKIKKYGVKKISINRNVGDVSEEIENATSRAGYFIIEGESYSEMLLNISKTFDEILILNEKGENLVKWTYGTW